MARALSKGTASVARSPAQTIAPGAGQTASLFSVAGIQTKLKVSSAGDSAENEADDLADHVVTPASKSPPAISRLPLSETGNGSTQGVAQRKLRDDPPSDELVQRKAEADGGSDLEAAAARAIATKGTGEPLRPDVRRTLESHIGADLGGVRVHQDAAAHESSEALRARAFTHQGDIWLGKGESQGDVHLMAHEAAHVVQQGAAPLLPAAAPRNEAANTPASGTGGNATSATTAGRSIFSTVLSTSSGSSSTGAATAKEAPAKVAGHAARGETPDPKSTGSSGAANMTHGASVASSIPDANEKAGAKSPGSDPAFAAVVQHVTSIASHQKAPDAKVSVKVGAAYAAVDSKKEIPGRAAAKKTDDFEQAIDNPEENKPFDREAFVQALLDKINVTAPKSLADVADFDKNNNLDSVKQDLNSGVKKGEEDSQGRLPRELQQSPRADDVHREDPHKIPEPQAGAVPQVAAAGAAPKAATDKEISLQSGPQAIDQQMADSSVTEDQLRDSNEPDFQDALEQKKDVEQAAVAAPLAYRAQEPELLQSARNESQQLASQKILGMHGIRQNRLGMVKGSQSQAQKEEEKQRDAIYGTIEGFYKLTKTGVEARLRKLDEDVNRIFSVGAKIFQEAFQEDVDSDVSSYKEKRYDSLIGGSYRWWRDKFKGMPGEVNDFYKKRLKEYQDRMKKLLCRIADVIVTGLNDAKNLIAAGRKAIEGYVATLEPQWQVTAKKAAEQIQQKFDSLDESVKDKRDELIDSLAGKYNENLQKINARIEEMKQENRGLVDKVVGAIKGVIQTIKHLKDLLLNVLSRAATAIGLIIAHPIRFLGNLVDAGKQGFNNFKDHIVDHLKEGFLEWLFGAVADAGIQLPKNFDLQGILNLVLQVLGLTRANIRKRAVDILGEKVVSAIEGAAEIFKVLVTEGPGGLLKYLEGKLDDVIGMAIEKVKTFVMERILMAGVKWLIGLLNPASAFVKACMAIYDIIMFFVEHGSQILDLVNTIIDSITEIAEGAISNAAAAVEKSLARAIPVMIGFLASLLGVGGIGEKIQEILETIRRPINQAIDWVINKAAALGRGIVGGAKKIANLIFPPEHFSAEDGDHTVTAVPKGEDYEIVVHSETRGVQEFIKFARKQADENSIAGVEHQIDDLDKKYTAWKGIVTTDDKGKKEKEKRFVAIARLVESIWKKVASEGPVPDSVIHWSPRDSRGRATGVVADPLTKKGADGGPPKADIPGWDQEDPGKRSPEGRIRAHLLHYALHGPGEAYNLTPTSNSVNALMYTKVESHALKALGIRKNATSAKVPKATQLHYETKVTYNDRLTGVNKYFAKSIEMRAVDKKTNNEIAPTLNVDNQ